MDRQEQDRTTPLDTESVSSMAIPDTGDVNICAITKDIADAKFRVQCRRILLTYRTHVDKDQMRAHLCGLRTPAAEVFVAHEQASSDTDYAHSHVYVDLAKERIDIKNCRYFDYDDGSQILHPHIKVINTKGHLDNVWRYLCKEDKENLHLLERCAAPQKACLFDKVMACLTPQDVLRMAVKPSDAPGLLCMFKHKPRETPEPEPLTEDWQVDLADELEERPKKREIVWYYDALGGTGKTDFALHMLRSGKAILLTNLGGDKDAGQLMETALASPWDGRVILLDLSRSKEGRDSLYSPLEAYKNGSISNTKYGSAMLNFAVPHVIVFANWLPDMSKLSMDKWRIRRLTRDADLVRCEHMNLKEVKRLAIEQDTFVGHADRIANLAKSTPGSALDKAKAGLEHYRELIAVLEEKAERKNARRRAKRRLEIETEKEMQGYYDTVLPKTTLPQPSKPLVWHN